MKIIYLTLNTQYVTPHMVLIIKGVKKMSETRDILEGIYNGEIPVRRRNPQTGATEDVYFYYDDDREELREVKNNNRGINFQNIFDNMVQIVTPGTYALGNLAADVQIAFDYYEQMKRTNEQLISKYGRNTGAANRTDEYYHPLLQCHFGQMGDNNKINGLLLGYAKEAIMDYGPKRFKGIKHDEIMSDSGKDLYYNELGNKIGANNQNRPCVDLMDFLRTENMRNENIR